MGTALNKILKDMITRFHQMNVETRLCPWLGLSWLTNRVKIEEQYKKKKKNKDEVPIKILDKNVESLQKNGYKFT